VISLTVFIGLAAAGGGIWAGVPLQDLTELGVGSPTLAHHTSAWRAPLDGGGIVDLWWFETQAEALTAAQARVTSSSQRPLPPLGQDRWGAPGEILLVRDRNVVLFVRSGSGGADEAMSRLQAALVVESEGPDFQTLTVDGMAIAWDATGRRRVVED
jgi:hypothetical protein